MIRSRTRWMEEGERSSKYFCNLEKRSCEKKCIYKIKNENAEDVFTQTDIIKEIHNYFQKHYSENDVVYYKYEMNEEFLDNIDIPKLSDDYKQILDQPCMTPLFPWNKTKLLGMMVSQLNFTLSFGRIFRTCWLIHINFLLIMGFCLCLKEMVLSLYFPKKIKMFIY